MYVAIPESVFVMWVLVNFFLSKGSSLRESSHSRSLIIFIFSHAKSCIGFRLQL